MRIALFGGSFDPPHRGHSAIAKAAADHFALAQVLWSPAGRQPLKRDGHFASYEQRLAMVTLACYEDPRFIPSCLDAPHPDNSPNYTVDTLTALQAAYPDAQLFNLVGADTFAHLANWREPARLLQLAEWIVVNRPGHPFTLPPDLILTSTTRARIHPLSDIHEEVSATDLRRRLAHGDPCAGLLLPSVEAYVAVRHLYV